MAPDEVSVDCFDFFVQVCESRLKEYRDSGTTAWGFKQEGAWVRSNAWECSELIKKLHVDPRYVPHSQG